MITLKETAPRKSGRRVLMARQNEARRQKKIAKQKAKHQAKRSFLAQRSSADPTVRLQHAEKWPVVRALVAEELWDEGIGYLLIAREEPDGQLVFASFLVDVYCLGVKDAFWRPGTRKEFQELVRQMDEMRTMVPIAPECLAKIVKGAVDYARPFGFSPHPDYHHASKLLEGIDPAACPETFEFGREGRPFYFRGPNESVAQAQAIATRVRAAGGDYIIQMEPGEEGFPAVEEEFDGD
jgi:hypothetical protein